MEIFCFTNTWILPNLPPKVRLLELVWLVTPVIGNFFEIKRNQNVTISYNNSEFQEYSTICRML